MPPTLPTKKTWEAAQVRRVLGFGLLALVLLGIGVCVAENYRGHLLWNRYRLRLEGKGERFDLPSIIPASAPPEQNFAATPFFAPFLDYIRDESDGQFSARWKDQRAYERNRALAGSLANVHGKKRKRLEIGQWQIGTLRDLEEWRQAFSGDTNFPFAQPPQDAARDVLAALRRYDPTLEELRAACGRPYRVFPVHYDEHFYALLPHLSALRGLGQVVCLRAVANLEAGKSTEALRDIELCLDFVEALKSEAFSVSQVVRMSMAQDALQPVWEGLVRERWNDAQLAEIQLHLERIDFLREYARIVRTERNTGIYLVDLLRTGQYRQLGGRADGAENIVLDYSRVRFLPGGVFRQNQLALAEFCQERLLPLVEPDVHRVRVADTKTVQNASELSGFHPYRLVLVLTLRPICSMPNRFAVGQAGIDLAMIACALERERLATGNYPQTLEPLSPKFLSKIPPDVITGQPLKYRRIPNGRFVLYSVGWNEREDGGVAARIKQRAKFNPLEGDWVWSYPAAAEDKKLPL